jgi:hypothetical protein
VRSRRAYKRPRCPSSRRLRTRPAHLQAALARSWWGLHPETLAKKLSGNLPKTVRRLSSTQAIRWSARWSRSSSRSSEHTSLARSRTTTRNRGEQKTKRGCYRSTSIRPSVFRPSVHPFIHSLIHPSTQCLSHPPLLDRSISLFLPPTPSHPRSLDRSRSCLLACSRSPPLPPCNCSVRCPCCRVYTVVYDDARGNDYSSGGEDMTWEELLPHLKARNSHTHTRARRHTRRYIEEPIICLEQPSVPL